MNWSISQKDRSILVELAKKQYELSQLPVMKQTIADWEAMNNFRQRRPMILLEMGTFIQEMIPQRMRCEGEFARKIEWNLFDKMLPHEVYTDDFVVPDYYAVNWDVYFDLFDFRETRVFAEDSEHRSLGHQFQHVISDLEEDYPKLSKSTWGVNRESTMKRMEVLSDLFGSVLPVKHTMDALYSVPTQKIVHMMGMETMFISMMDYPELFAEMMNRIADETCEYFDWLEKEKLLLPTVGNERLGQGTYCYTEELPSDVTALGRDMKVSDVWGFMDSQETVGVSADMIGEFIFPCYKKIADRYGLLSYGCCEPVHPIWEDYLSKFQHLRKVSISPWCDQVYMGEQLRGRNTIFQRKPSPNYLGVDPILDESAFKAHIIETIEASRGCTLEFTQRDVYTIHNNPEKARRYIEVIRECIEDCWTPA